MTTSTYTRRDVRRMKPDILGKYHDLVMTNDLTGYEKLLDEYPHITGREREELLADFRRDAENALRRRWLGPKWR